MNIDLHVTKLIGNDSTCFMATSPDVPGLVIGAKDKLEMMIEVAEMVPILMSHNKGIAEDTPYVFSITNLPDVKEEEVSYETNTRRSSTIPQGH